MEKKYIKNLFRWYDGESELKNVHVDEYVNERNKVVSKNENDDILQVIFSVDERTGLPQNDIGLLIHRKYSDDVLRAIEQLGIQKEHIDVKRLSSDVDTDLIISRRAQYGTEPTDVLGRIINAAKNLKNIGNKVEDSKTE